MDPKLPLWMKHLGLRRHLLSYLARTSTMRREVFVGFTFLLFVIVMSTAGYVLIEGWNWFDGFYMTFITITTIGYGEVETLSRMGRVFTLFVALFGIGTGGFILTRLTSLLLANQHLRERRLRRVIDRMEDHLIICGHGRIGRRIVQDLRHNGQPFVVIEAQDDRIETLRNEQVPCVHGDAQEEENLRAAGIERARGLILTLPDDAQTVFVTLTAREISPDLFIIARTNDHENRSKLLTAGANKVIAPIEVGADRMAQVVVRPNVDQFMEEVLRTGALGLQMEEVHVREGAPLAGRTLAESAFRQQFEAVVVAIIEPDEDDMNFNPGADMKIQAGDILVVLGNPEMIQRLEQEGCTP